jgi:predicted PurR-regulated permease PerM
VTRAIEHLPSELPERRRFVPRPLVPLHVAALAACVAAIALVVVPVWPYVVFALWTAGLSSVLLAPITRVVRRRSIAAAVVTTGLVFVVVVPLVLAVVPLAMDAVALVRHAAFAGDARRMLETLVAGGPDQAAPRDGTLTDISQLVSAHGAKAWSVLRTLAGATTRGLVGLVVFVAVAYGRLAHGEEAYAWVERHAPVSPRHLARLAGAFNETGRGLLVGIGGAAVLQGVLATIGFALAGISHALVLGLLTLFAAFVPVVGTAIVVVPVAIGLALTGRPDAALVGLSIVLVIENVIKPLLTRYGRLRLPVAVMFVSMLGGALVAGPSGLVLGPIVVRLALEMVLIAKDERDAYTAVRSARRRSR